MEKLIFKKLLYDCLIFFLISLISCSIVILVFQAVNFLDLMIEDGRNYSVYIQYTLLNFPKIINKILPFALLFSFTYVLAKYELNNELMIYWNFGINKIQLINFFLKFSLFLMIFQITSSVYLVPKSLELSRNLMKESNIDFFESFIKPKRFNDTIKGLTIYAENKDENGFLSNIYIKKDNKDDSFQITYAKSGKFKGAEKNKILELYDGKTINKASNKISNFSFTKSDFSLAKLDTNLIKSNKNQETSTISHFKCLNKLYKLNINFLNGYKITQNCSFNNLDNIFKELYKRFIIPFYIPVLIMISMMLIIKNKEKINYLNYRILIFLFGFIVIIVSEVSLKLIQVSLLSNLKFVLLPSVIFMILYLPLLYKLKLKFNHN